MSFDWQIKFDLKMNLFFRQSMILRRSAFGLQMQMGSLYDAHAGKFTSVHFPVDILMNQLGRQKFGNIQLRSTISAADPWTVSDFQIYYYFHHF